MNEQETAEYWQSKIGCVGASKIKDVMAKGQGKTRANYMAELIAARLTGSYPETYQSADMTRGIELEPIARECYAFQTGYMVETCGFIPHPTIERSGASPDGLIGIDGLLEIKSPNAATHIKYKLANKVPAEYVKQVQWQLASTDRKWAEFISYHPGFGTKLQLFKVRVERDEELIAKMEDAVIDFLAEVEQTIEKLETA